MAAYAFYSSLYFNDAIYELERFLEKYKNHPNTDYAYYLLAICHYNQIVDEKKDLGEIIKAKNYFNLLIKKFPETDFAEDASFKLELIDEILASKELYLANYYLSREKWIPAMNRYKKIVNQYETTIFVEEALYRLVELNYKIGLEDEAKKYTALLGYNYQSSDWYEKSMKFDDLKKEYKKKINELKRHNKFYFDKNTPKISDHEYDNLKKEIIDLEKNNPFLKNANSPSNSVGYTPSKNFIKSNHRVKMLSLSNAFNREDLENF